MIVDPNGNVTYVTKFFGSMGGGGGTSVGISEITSTDSSVTITNSTGPTVDLAVVFPAAITLLTSIDGSVTITNPGGPTTDLSVVVVASDFARTLMLMGG